MQKAIENVNFLSTINIDLPTLQDELQKSTKTSSGYPVLIPMSTTHSSDTLIP